MTLPVAGNPISFSQVDVELGYSATAQISMNDSAVRTLFATASGAIAMSNGYGKSNTSVPGAPTGVSASATSCSAISVSFTAPACTGHLTIDYYQAVCTATGTNSATGSSSPISVTGLSSSTSYTFKVRAHNSLGYGSYSSSTGTATTSAPTGSTAYTSPGCYTFTVPSGVTSASVLLVAAGGYASKGGKYYCNCNGYYLTVGGAGLWGGSLGYKNSISVTPTSSHNLHVGNGACSVNRLVNLQTWYCSSTYMRVIPSLISGGCPRVGTCGGSAGGACGNGYTSQGGCSAPGGGGGGAGGYGNYPCCNSYGKGGAVSLSYGNPGVGAANICGGGGGGSASCYTSVYGGGGGGGVGIYGKGTSGGAQNGTSGTGQPSYGGYAGSGGGNGAAGAYGGNGGAGGSYGGGGGGAYKCSNFVAQHSGGVGGNGAARIVWPGTTRTFPSTSVGSP